jgi:hypothetical protein
VQLQGYFSQLPRPIQDDAIALVETLWKRHGPSSEERRKIDELPELPELMDQSAPVPIVRDYSGPDEYIADDDDMEGKQRKDEKRRAEEADDARRALRAKPKKKK